MKGIILHDNEVRQLSTTGKVLVVRPIQQRKRKDGAKLLPELLQKIGVGKASPYGEVGTKFFVKEAFYLPVWRTVWYRATDQITDVKWKSAMRMPESYSRFTVETEAVECKRVQAITFQECVNAGYDMPMKEMECDAFDLQKRCVISAWNRQHPKHPWSSNPSCWFCILKLVKNSARPLNSQSPALEKRKL